MKRIYFLVPNLEVTTLIVNELLLARVEERRLHVLAKRDTPLGTLPEASFLQKTDFVPAMERGLAVGGIAGTLAGLVALATPAGPILGGGAIILAGALAGATTGVWIAGMVGLSVGNSRLTAYEEAIERGEILLMVDVRRDRVDEIHRRVSQLHPEVKFEGTDPTIPAFP
ncbi:hypothetical protein [Methyloterricola oryzae]|uniref:hypothetical protein n=1 Tax=Methyloterricola oryzae TaxID=1495050 RepID=UPI0005EB4A41|nr:hypothetical protein [Methyloterricola oryzae]